MLARYFFILMLTAAPVISLSAAVKVLAFSGSTRAGSFNQDLVKEAAAIAKSRGTVVTLINLKNYEMPFYHADLEISKGMPPNAKRFRDLMLENDRIIIASPEYNGSLTAILKNALDWASRSEKGEFSLDAFRGKKFALMSASPGLSGGKRGLDHLVKIIGSLGGQVVQVRVAVPQAHLAFDKNRNLINDALKKQLNKEVAELLQ